MKITQNLEAPINSIDFGYSMTAGIMPEAIREDGIDEPLTVRMANPIHNPDFLLILGENGFTFDNHIDIDTTAFSLVYDLKYKRKIERIYIGSFYNGETNYTIGEFELFASNERETLFNEENKILTFDNIGKQTFCAPRNNADFLFDAEDLSARFFAFRQLNSNSPDTISRIRNVCLYEDRFTYTRLFLSNNTLTGGHLEGLVPEISGEAEGCPSYLTNKIALDENNLFSFNKAEMKFSLKKAAAIDNALIVGFGNLDFELYSNDKKLSFKFTDKSLEEGRTLRIIDIENSEEIDSLTFKFDGIGTIDQILAYSSERKIKVSDEVITEDFVGLGANVLPHHLFESSRMLGFTEAYMELEKRRINISNPAFVRLWFQIDWFVMDEDGYINRKYVFNSPKMMALYKYLDALKASNIEIELNFGWKIGYTAQSWFSFPNIFNRKNSAPRDLEHFATSCSDCLKELIINRGYDNIKYLTFYNEPNGGTPKGWDFICPEGYDIKDYWNKMLTAVDNQLKEDGIRDLVKIWASEVAGSVDNFKTVIDWTDYFNKTSPEKYEYNCFHLYRATYDEAIKFGKLVKELSGNHPALVTEFATYGYGYLDGIDYNFEQTNISSALGFINSGLAGLAFWILSGVYIDEHFFLDDKEANFWRFPTDADKAAGINASNRRFYELGLITNYMPRHSKIISTTWEDEGIQAATCKIGESDYTIAVNVRRGGIFNRNIKIELPEGSNKKFYKHVYRLDTPQDGNMVLPPVVDTIDANDLLLDTVDGDYSFVIYTTLPPVKQVVMDEIEIFMKPGETKQLSAHILDGEGKLKWSLPDCHYNIGYKGTITEDGLYTADEICYATRVEGNIKTSFAVKAETETGEYAIAMIKITD